MREILFRGQTQKRGQKVWMDGTPVDGQWVYGGVLQGIGDFSVIYGGKNVNDPGEGLDKWFVYTDTIGQFTGLTDKNGKKIFEGDILTIARKMDGMGTYYVPTLACPVNVEVKWDFCGWMWETLCEDKRYLTFPEAWCNFECEVIGNIHDNPELLVDGERREGE